MTLSAACPRVRCTRSATDNVSCLLLQQSRNRGSTQRKSAKAFVAVLQRGYIFRSTCATLHTLLRCPHCVVGELSQRPLYCPPRAQRVVPTSPCCSQCLHLHLSDTRVTRCHASSCVWAGHVDVRAQVPSCRAVRVSCQRRRSHNLFAGGAGGRLQQGRAGAARPVCGICRADVKLGGVGEPAQGGAWIPVRSALGCRVQRVGGGGNQRHCAVCRRPSCPGALYKQLHAQPVGCGGRAGGRRSALSNKQLDLVQRRAE